MWHITQNTQIYLKQQNLLRTLFLRHSVVSLVHPLCQENRGGVCLLLLDCMAKNVWGEKVLHPHEFVEYHFARTRCIPKHVSEPMSVSEPWLPEKTLFLLSVPLQFCIIVRNRDYLADWEKLTRSGADLGAVDTMPSLFREVLGSQGKSTIKPWVEGHSSWLLPVSIIMMRWPQKFFGKLWTFFAARIVFMRSCNRIQ